MRHHRGFHKAFGEAAAALEHLIFETGDEVGREADCLDKVIAAVDVDAGRAVDIVHYD